MKMKLDKIFAVFIVFLAVAALSGCASKTDVEAMQSERQQDLNRIRQLESELTESREQLKAEIEKSNDPIRAKSADMWAEIQSLRAEFARLRGEMDAVNIRLDRQVGATDSPTTMDSLANRVAELEFALENQLSVDLPKVREERNAALAAQAPAPMAVPAAGAAADAATASDDPADAAEAKAFETTPPAGAQAPAAPVEQPADTDPAKALYDKAYALYKEGQFERARSYWAEFTDTFKGHAYIPSAVFWQGQCYYQLKDYARAVILYEDVIEKYKKSSKFKAALLKAGYSWQYLGKPELAKMRFQEVVEKFPQSVEATQAKRSLDKMK
ncbi:MAG: tetratricopeptide repeat protein [Pseudodesulfovibrio sp.]|uniref:tetratricopeptide repeat protein n=1 Tax=Pseudodesulfovibrio sp. TaxID=2035812 RepID=UPI003D14007C